MQMSKSAFIGLLASLVTGLALGAAKDPNVVITVTPFPDGDAQTLASSITLSSARYPTHVSYRVVLQNNTTNTLNRSFFSASTDVVGATNDSAINPGDIYVEAETTPGSVSNCAAIDRRPTTVRCKIGTGDSPTGGSLAPGQGVALWVVVKAPTAGTQLVLTSTFGGDEGQGAGNGCCDSVRTTSTHLIDPLSDTEQAFKRELKSFVKTTGGTFFTGRTGVATADDPWTTRVTVPTVTTGLFNALPFTTATVFESVSGPSCSAINKQCNQTALKIPGTFGNLQITLQQHPSIIKNGSRIENWRIAYSHDLSITTPVTLLRCDATNPAGPRAGVPCIQACQEYSSKSFPAVPRSMWGIFECKINAVDNGSYVAE
jgi:hypothetical protein